MPINDNDVARGNPAYLSHDAHGHAALLLVESLIHGLRERSVLSIGELIDIVETAVHVQADVVEAADGNGAIMRRSHALLSAIAVSLTAGSTGRDGDGR